MMESYSDVFFFHKIMSSTPNIMMKSQDAKTFAHARILLVHNIISTASNLMMKARDTVTFAYDIII